MKMPETNSMDKTENLIRGVSIVFTEDSDKITRDYTVEYIKNLVKNYETQTGQKYKGFLPKGIEI